MTTLAGPSYLTPTWRYAGDDWSGSNALVYTVYQNDAQGNPTTTPMDLTGFTVSGMIVYQSRPIVAVGGRYCEQPPAAPLQGVVGAIVLATAGTISLSVPDANTIMTPQAMSTWYADIANGSPGQQALLIARPRVTDPYGADITVGLQPLYVF